MANRTRNDRFGWEQYLRPFFFKELPSQAGWSATLGTLCLLLFGLLAVTGIFLAMYYNPSPDKAYQSVDYIMNAVQLGSVLRGIHHWGASAMVLAVFVHLLSVFFSGSYKAPREMTWTAGVFLFFIVLALGFTGYLLPWDMKAYWATVVGSNMPKTMPVAGEFISRLIRGGEGVSGLTLTRFYAVHAMLLPACLAAFGFFHIYLVRVHGLAEKREAVHPKNAESIYRFYPEHALRSLSVFGVVFLILIGLSEFGSLPKEPIAGTVVDFYLPRPEWYYLWIFQLLTYFSGPWEGVATLAFFALGAGLIFCVPFLGLPEVSGAAERPLSTAAGVTAVVAIVYLTVQAFAGARPYGEMIPVPDRALTAAEQRGLEIFIQKECSYCHQVQGRGGHRTGPDLANIAAKGKSIEELVKFVKDPQAVRPSSSMPKYELPERDLRALAEFMLSLDFRKFPMKIVRRRDIVRETNE